MKKMINVAVGTVPKIKNKYGGHGNDYIYYSGHTESIYPEDDLNSLIHSLTQLKKKYQDRYQDLRFEEVIDCGCSHDCSCSPSYVLYGRRYELDIEYQFRINKEKVRQQQVDEQDKAQFEKLKRKFEQ
jgi:hypothetical protein